MKYLIYSLLLMFTVNLSAQGLDEEIGFIYTKAKYLIETDRVEEAVKELNKVISRDGKFEDALLLRAEAKYALGAYAGVKKDLARYMESNGITPRVARLYGLTDFQSGNKKAALNSLNLAMAFIDDDRKMYEVRGEILEGNGKLIKACSDYEKAANLGSSKAERKAKSLCGSKTKKRNNKRPTEVVTTKPKKKKDAPVILEKPKKDESVDEPIIDNEERDTEFEEEASSEELEEEMEKEYIDDTPREIIVDEDLTLMIMGEGLGTREITNQPNILIISDDSGEVAVNVCVSKGGRVTSAEFDNGNSTIRKQSLISLAVRKAKDFWFAKGDKEEQCGKIVFQIHGS